MPQIIITTEGPGTSNGREVHRERIVQADVETEAAGHLLVERIGWALNDASRIEELGGEEPAAAFTGNQGTIADSKVL